MHAPWEPQAANPGLRDFSTLLLLKWKILGTSGRKLLNNSLLTVYLKFLLLLLYFKL